MKVSWCRGTRGEIRIGGNPQGAAKDVLTELGKSITNGGDADEARDAIAGAEIEPFVDWDIQRPGDWKISGEVTITFDKDGVKSAGGKLKVEKGAFEGSLDGQGRPRRRLEHHAAGQVDAREEAEEARSARRDELFFPYEYECELERDIAATKKPVKKTPGRQFPEHSFVYFKYASDEINPKLTTKADLDALETPDGQRLQGHQRPGVHVARGPARPLARSGRRATRRLSQAPRRRGAARWPPSGCLDGGCITGNDARDPKDVELLRLDLENLDDTIERVRGQGARGRTSSRCLGDRPRGRRASRRRRRPRSASAAARGRKAKAEVIYEYLRRARIDLERTEHHEWTEDEIVPGRTERHQGQLPGGRPRGGAVAVAHQQRGPLTLPARPLP